MKRNNVVDESKIIGRFRIEDIPLENKIKHTSLNLRRKTRIFDDYFNDYLELFVYLLED